MYGHAAVPPVAAGIWRLAASAMALTVIAELSAFAEGGNLLGNPGFEDADDSGALRSWTAVDFRTGGHGARAGGARSGQYCAAVSGKDEAQRVCWQQKLAVPQGTRAIAFGGFYRTRGVADKRDRGPSIRILFHRDMKKWDEISLQQAFFQAREEWGETPKTVFLLPPGTKAVVMQLFHWFTAGETCWDDVWLRPASDPEAAAAARAFPRGAELDREPTYGKNLPYSPADGAVVRLNPPPFLWLPSGRGVAYRLQIARDEGFEGDDVIDLQGLGWCCEMLTHKLDTGRWFWRYGVEREGHGTAWSRSRGFVVPAAAEAWEYPGRDSFRVPDAHPRLFFRPEQLPDVRRRGLAGDLRSTADALVRATRKQMKEELVPEPDWLPKDRAKRGPAYTLTFRATRPPMNRMETAALAYLLTGEADCGEEAKRRILHFFSWDPKGSTNVFHNDEPAMWVMMRGVRAYDWTYDLFSDEERAKVEASIRVRAADFYTKLTSRPFENNPYASHSGRIIGFLGEAALVFLPEWPEARTWLDYIAKIYWGVYPAWGKDDGGWNEGPGYWSAYMSFGLHFVTALRVATGVDLSQRPFFRSTPYYALYVAPPRSRMSPFGDGTQFRPSRLGSLMYWFSTLNRDPRARWYADVQGRGPSNGVLGVVLRDDSLQGLPPFDLPLARLFDGVGLACLHTDLAGGENDIAFIMKSSPYGAVSHGHNDQNCFVIEAFGEPLAIASGYYNRYGSAHHAGWTRQTKAKCGITFDGGQGQDRGWQAQGAITAFVHGAAFDLVSGDATRAYGDRLTSALRDVIHVRPGVYVIRDSLASREPRRFEFQLHALDRMAVDESARSVVIQRPKASLNVQFLLPDGVAFSQTDQFDPPPAWPPEKEYANNWHLTAALRDSAAQAQFLTVAIAVRNGAESRLVSATRVGSGAASGVALRWADGGRTVIGLGASRPQAPVVLEGLTSDARIFAVTYARDGTPTAWLMQDGTLLRDSGRALLRADEPVTATCAPGTTVGRIDTSGGGTTLTVWWPCPTRALTRDGDAVVGAALGTEDEVALPVAPGCDSIQVWTGKPVSPGPVAVSVGVGKHTQRLSGMRRADGFVLAYGRVDFVPGAYRGRLPADATMQGGSRDEAGRLWFRRSEAVTLQGRGLAEGVQFVPDCVAAVLPPLSQRDIPQGLVFEAEQRWSEEGGSIRVSGGGHKNVSGNDNLWGWNTPGHTLLWDVVVAEAGRYEVWFVAASRTGLLTEFTVDGRSSRALWFEPTGGWGRTVADEWRAFRVLGSDDRPAPYELAAGKHRLALTNRMGMGLNLDRIVLVPAR